MRLLPYDSFQIETTLSLEESLKKLESQVSQHRSRSIRKVSSTQFHGKIENNEFRIQRTISRKNSFQPLVTGVLSESKTGTFIQVEMGPRPIYFVFILIWLGFIVFSAFRSLQNTVTQLCHPTLFLFIGFVIAFYLGPFWTEAKKQKEMLIDIFEGKEVPQ